MTKSEDSTSDLPDLLPSKSTTEHMQLESVMDVDKTEAGVEGDVESFISTSLPSSFLFGARTLNQRGASTLGLSTPHTRLNPLHLEGERIPATPKRRSIVPRDEDDNYLSTPSRISASTAAVLPVFSRSDSLLSRLNEKGTLLGKHPQTPSPDEERGVRSKGFKGLSTKARFNLDYLSESQWYSDYAHHLTAEYLEELFHLDRRVMFREAKSGSGLYPDYLTANFYTNEVSLGAGQFADVLKVQSKQSKEFYAVKRLLKTVKGAMERKHYLNEVRNMWRVEKSPNVLQLLEAWEQKGKIYMRMELCKLGNLKSALLAQKKYGGFDERRMWKCLTDLASGLRAIHDSNVIHLDIKSENVFVTASGSLKIGDFGLSLTYPIEVKDITEGDKYYVAQELLRGQCGKYSDIFSLGMTMYEMVTNRIGDLPGEGPEWHRLRAGDVDMSEYMVGKTLSPPASRQLTDPSGVTSGGVSASPSEAETLLADSSQEVVVKVTSPHKLFAKEMLELIQDMIQPAFEKRPAASVVVKCAPIQKILAIRSEQRSKGVRSDEAMSGLLLQSI
ncbi:hypothetical protein BGZ98_005652 [Dissophora globulifera]|nr:hypothetical protein BGZ98_005652 [Dissophora globulifera]